MIPDAPFAARWRRLEAGLAARGARGFLASHLPDIRYLCGFSGSNGLLLFPGTGAPVLLTDFRYEEQAAAELADGVRLRVVRDGAVGAVAEALSESGSRGPVAFDPGRLTVLDRRRLGDSATGVEWVEAVDVLSGLRAVKDRGEVERIRRAVAIGQGALERTLAVVRDRRSGLRERDVAARLEYELRSGGSDALPFEPIVASGPRTSLPHARQGDVRLMEHELLLLDFGASFEGYCCDITRTFVLGGAREWQRELHAAVREAQEAAVAAAAPGTPVAEVDAAARRCLAERDRDRLFGHGTGHGIGLEVHEEPRLSSRCDDVLEAGNVVTVEPGVYLPGRGGVRIEDDVHVTADGPRRLTDFPRDLIEL